MPEPVDRQNLLGSVILNGAEVPLSNPPDNRCLRAWLVQPERAFLETTVFLPQMQVISHGMGCLSPMGKSSRFAMLGKFQMGQKTTSMPCHSRLVQLKCSELKGFPLGSAVCTGANSMKPCLPKVRLLGKAGSVLVPGLSLRVPLEGGPQSLGWELSMSLITVVLDKVLKLDCRGLSTLRASLHGTGSLALLP